MRHLFMAVLVGCSMAAITLGSCEKVELPAKGEAAESTTTGGATSNGTSEGAYTRKFTFTLKGDFNESHTDIGTRGYLQADGKDMTDLWVVDCMGGEVKQKLRRSNTDEDFGAPSMQLELGSHVVYFCASRGSEPVWSADFLGLSWSKVSDTFYCAYPVDVVKTSNGNRAVTLARAVARINVNVTDKVPVGARKLRVSTKGTKSLSLLTGFGTQTNFTQDLAVYAEDEGKLLPAMMVYTLCPSAEEWTADVTLQYLDATDQVMYTRTISDVGLRQNRETILSGSMVDVSNGFSLSLSVAWEPSEKVDF